MSVRVYATPRVPGKRRWGRIGNATSIWIDVTPRFPNCRNRGRSTAATGVDMAAGLAPKILEEHPGAAQEGRFGGPGTLHSRTGGRGPRHGEEGGQQEEDGDFAESGHGRLPGDRSGTASMDARAGLR